MTADGHWAAQQLTEVIGLVSRARDEHEAARWGVEAAAEAVDAEVAALVRDGAVVTSLGWPRFEIPERELALVVERGSGDLPIPGQGPTPCFVWKLDDEEAHLVLARGAGGAFEDDELALLRGVARSLSLTIRMLRTIVAERGLRARSDLQVRENARLLDTLRQRQRVLDAMARIQRAISLRKPLEEVLDAVVSSAGELLGDAAPAALMLPGAEQEAGMLSVVASRGFVPGLIERRPVRRIGQGIGGRAAAEGRLVVAEEYASSPDALPEYVEAGLQAAMAAPVHEDGRVVGSLVVSSFAAGRRFSHSDQEMLRSFAEHASLALTDARRTGEMLHQALHDDLTGLANRALFADRLQHALTQGRRRGTTCGVIVLDVDRFKVVNDSLGYDSGDELLAVVARRLVECLRTADTAARLGGDEFGLLLEDLGGADEALAVAARVEAALRAPVAVGGRELLITASLGIALGTAGADDLLREADVAMYRAKAQGRDRVVLFHPGMDTGAAQRLDLQADLQRAIEHDELVVHYQPIVRLEGGELIGCEALVRWLHPTRGMVAPAEFIPLAEETGLIVDLGRQVLRTACRWAADWNRRHPGRGIELMTVNLSGRQLTDPGVVADVEQALAASGLDPATLVLEITETVIMEDTETTIARLTELRALGVQLAVDDFGTGYSSLHYLRRFPIDILKMAKPFVDGLGVDEEGTALAAAIVDLAASLRLRCVAEGIEQGHQLHLLRELACDLGQGYHFARPMPDEALAALLGEPAAAA